MRTGNFGNSRSIGQGVAELKIDAGPGYRIYYLRESGEIVILLCGGDKRSQTADMLRAQAYAGDYWERR
jgi:putative addiction module killer protein